MQKTNDNDNNLKLQKTILTDTHTHTLNQKKQTKITIEKNRYEHAFYNLKAQMLQEIRF